MMTLSKKNEDAYFAASNSADGFCSYYPQCFDDRRIDHLYAIKGGPGTGKSRFMREVAEAAQVSGWRVEYVYCSSDPNSLDGVILTLGERAVALLDATAPHVYEPHTPGAREELIDLGAFWNAERLGDQMERIEEINREKRAAYRRAYRYLASAGEMRRTCGELTLPFLRLSAIETMADRLTRELPFGSGYRMQPALIGSIGMQGEVRLDSYFARAKCFYLIEDCHGAAQYLLDALGKIAVQKRLAVRLSHDPLLPECLDGIFFCESGTAFAVGDRRECQGPLHVIGMRRFVQTAGMKPIRGSLVYAERMRRAMLGGAIEELERVREAHFLLEAIYADAMDFSAKEAFTKSFCAKLFSLQK